MNALRITASASVASLALAWSALAGAEGLDEQQQQGRVLFNGTCVHCHAPGFWGANVLRRRSGEERSLVEHTPHLAPEYIRFAIRRGVGAMPAYRPTELSETDIAAIIAYMTRAAGE